jgi:uncharacterized protein (DUF58 family)
VSRPVAHSSTVALSGRGRSFVTVGLVSLLAGLVLGVTDLQRVGILLLALTVPAWLIVRQARAGLGVSHSAGPARTDVGDPIEAKLTLANPNAIATGPLRVTEAVPGGRPLRFSVAGVRARQRRTVSYPLPLLGRGRYSLGPTTVVASDPFGLVLATTVSTDRTELIVRPKAETLPGLSLPTAWRDGSASLSFSVGSGGSDDASIREYRYGDDLRKIHWRSTARSGSMMVRQEERPWQGETLVLLDTRRSAFATSPDAFEWAVAAAASIGVHLASRKRRVSAITGNGETSVQDGWAILDLLAETEPGPTADLKPLSVALRSAGADATIFAVLAAADGASFATLQTAGRSSTMSVAFLLDVASWQSGLNAVATGPDAAASRGSARTSQWLRSADTLRAAGWTVVPVTVGDELAQLWPRALGSQAISR